MKLSFTFDEKILDKITHKELIEEAINYEVNSIELCPDKKILEKRIYKDILNLTYNKININYHVPYFAHKFYEIYEFNKNKVNITKKYYEFINLIYDLQNDNSYNPIIVFHGAQYGHFINKDNGLYSTLTFIDWILNLFERKNLKFNLALESLKADSIRKVGDNYDDLLYITNKFPTENLGLCLDLAHYMTNKYPSNEIESNLLDSVIYSHIHGVDLNNGVSHIPLLKSDINFEENIKFLKSKNITINLELLVEFCKSSYINDLFNDINYLKTIK